MRASVTPPGPFPGRPPGRRRGRGRVRTAPQPLRSPIVLRRCVIVLVVAIGLVLVRGTVSGALAASHVAAATAIELSVRQDPTAQGEGAQGAEPPETQDTTDDGTQLYQLIAAGLLMLAGLMVILTWGYWKATAPAGDGRRR